MDARNILNGTTLQHMVTAQSNMTKTKPNKLYVQKKPSYTYPCFHKDVTNAVAAHIDSTRFHPQKGSDQDLIREYSTFVKAKFKCDVNFCPISGWDSDKVEILIRGFPNNGYNAVVRNQYCPGCEQLGLMTLDKDSHVERVAFRIKWWADVLIENQSDDEIEPPLQKKEHWKGGKRCFSNQKHR